MEERRIVEVLELMQAGGVGGFGAIVVDHHLVAVTLELLSQVQARGFLRDVGIRLIG